MNTKNEKIFSVSEFIALLNIGLKNSRVKIIGEVGEVKIGPTGHVYFSLRDEKEQSTINCIIWKSRYFLYGIKLEEGMKIISFGYPEIYPLSGRLSFISETIELAGEGEIKKEYERLKNKLTKEGLFEQERKKPMPVYPQKIGVITSLKGAVMADFSNNLAKFGFKVKIIDSRVEGQTAVSDLLMAMKIFKKQDIEVLVIMRGGGSLESLMPFNNELLVRETAFYPIPIIAAIGHHKDVPLLAEAADLVVSTPSIAATALSESWQQAVLLLQRDQRNILSSYEQILSNYYELMKNTIDKSVFGFRSMLSRISQQIEYAEKVINFNHPERQLRLGYSIARNKGKIIKSINNVKTGDKINIQVVDGEINSKVQSYDKRKSKN